MTSLDMARLFIVSFQCILTTESRSVRIWSVCLTLVLMTILLAQSPGLVRADSDLEAPLLISSNSGRSGEFSMVWFKVVNATSYVAQVTTDANFSSPLTRETNLNRATFSDLPAGWYFFRVMAKNEAANSSWSVVRHARVYDDPKLPTTSFTSITAAGGNVTCQWTAIPGANRCQVQICANIDYDPPNQAVDLPGPATSYTFKNLTDGSYQVRVRGYNNTAISDWAMSSVIIGSDSVDSSLLLYIIVIFFAVLVILIFLLMRRRKNKDEK